MTLQCVRRHSANGIGCYRLVIAAADPGFGGGGARMVGVAGVGAGGGYPSRPS